jgi:hypothetical protein
MCGVTAKRAQFLECNKVCDCWSPTTWLVCPGSSDQCTVHVAATRAGPVTQYTVALPCCMHGRPQSGTPYWNLPPYTLTNNRGVVTCHHSVKCHNRTRWKRCYNACIVARQDMCIWVYCLAGYYCKQGKMPQQTLNINVGVLGHVDCGKTSLGTG